MTKVADLVWIDQTNVVRHTQRCVRRGYHTAVYAEAHLPSRLGVHRQASPQSLLPVELRTGIRAASGIWRLVDGEMTRSALAAHG
jgi:hypothetical protein